MIRRNMKTVELRERKEEALAFGSTETDSLIDSIKIAIYERSVADYNQNDIVGLQYDYLGLTEYKGCQKDMYIKDGEISYKIKFVQSGKRYNQVFLERVI